MDHATNILKSALEAVEAAEIPSDLREAAFLQAIEMLRAGAADQSGKGDHNGGGGDGAPTESPRLKKVAVALGVPYDRIETLFVEHEDSLQVAADPAVLGSSTKERAKGVALLLAVGRQLGGWDDGATSDSYIRAEVDRLGVYDSTNYAKHVKELTAWFNVNGSGKSATYKLKFAGREHAKNWASSLVGE